MTRALLCCWLLAGGAAGAEGLDVATVARIQHEQRKANAEIDKKHGNKGVTEMTSEEQRARAEDKARAMEKILAPLGITEKEYARRAARLSREERKELAAAGEALEAAEKKLPTSAETPPAEEPKAQTEVTVQRGFSDKKPIEVEGSAQTVPVEHGLPVDEP